MPGYELSELGLEGLRGRYSLAARRDAMDKADLCAAALVQASRFSQGVLRGTAFDQLLRRIAELLDELDDSLLNVDLLRDRVVYERAAALHAGFAELERQRNGGMETSPGVHDAAGGKRFA